MPRFFSAFSAISVALVLATTTTSANADDEYSNVYGEALQPCSYDGMALTGYTRNGYCIDEQDDSGSHHICIDLSSLEDGGQNFCQVTGQSDWCSSQEMPCHEDSYDESCAIVNWCVCQWAFASYIQKSGGCDNIQTVVCESINMEALKAYYKMANKWNPEQKYIDALSCLVDRCGLDAKEYQVKSLASSPPIRLALFVILGVAGTSIFLLQCFRKCFRRPQQDSIDVDPVVSESRLL